MNKKYVKMILPAVIIFTAGAAIKAFSDLQKVKNKKIKIRKKPDGLILKDYLSLFFFGFNTAFFTFITPVYCILHEKVLYVTQ